MNLFIILTELKNIRWKYRMKERRRKFKIDKITSSRSYRTTYSSLEQRLTLPKLSFHRIINGDKFRETLSINLPVQDVITYYIQNTEQTSQIIFYLWRTFYTASSITFLTISQNFVNATKFTIALYTKNAWG